MAVTIGTNSTLIRDLDWVQHSFMLAGERVEVSKELNRFRNLSSADFKYTGSGFGQSIIINPTPQFTPFADIRRKGLWIGSGGNVKSAQGKSEYFHGMGRAYSEMIDDNRQVVHIRFGVTQYKGLISFFTGFYDNQSALLARQGRVSLAYYFGLLAGSMATLWLQPIILAGQGLNYILGRTSSKYMDLKPTMPLYWERVQVIMNNVGANLGVIPRFMQNTGAFNGNKKAFGVQDSNGKDVATGGVKDLENLADVQGIEDYKGHMHRIMPKIFRKDGTLDVQWAVLQGARRQVEWNNRVTTMTTAMGSNNSKESYTAIVDYLSRPVTGKDYSPLTMEDYLKNYHKSVIGSITDRFLDGDNVSDIVEKSVNAGDKDGLANLSKASATTEDAPVTDNAAGEVTGTDTAKGTNESFAAATEGKVAQTPSATEETKAPAEGATTTGIDAAALKTEVFKPRSQEMRTVIRGVEGSTATGSDAAALQKELETGETANVAEKFYKVVKGWLGQATETFDLEWKNGSAFLNLGVNYTGGGSMSIANATKETIIAGTLKGVSSTARDSRISLSDFKTGFSFIDGAVKMVGDVFSGAMDAVSMSGLMALAGNAFIDFPKQWDDSTATVPTANFTIELRSFTGNMIADYLYLYTTVSCLLAGATPLSTGAQSYTSPFVCEAYCRGSFAIRYGMITNLTVRHAVGNLGYTAGDRRPLAFDIDVEIADFSSVYHAAISNGMSPINIFKRVFDDDNAFGDYISTISGLQLDDMVNPKRKLSIKMATQIKNVKSWWSPTHIASRMSGSTPIQTLNKLFGPSTYAGT